MVSIYTNREVTERMNYILQHLFQETLGTPFRILRDRELFLRQTEACINYSDEELGKGIRINPCGLLSESGVRKIEELNESTWKGYFSFFRQEEGDIPFDLFSAAFYLLTLYEEYGSEEVDSHGRFRPDAALSFRKGFLDIPLIDRWADLLRGELTAMYPGTPFHPRKFRFISTFDIDLPYQYRKRGFLKNLGGAIKDLIHLRFGKVSERVSVLLGLKEDPYMEALLRIEALHKEAGKECFLFILLGEKGKYGITTVRPLTEYYHYLRELTSVSIGSHPSYPSYENPQLRISEKEELEKILGRPVTRIRHHFLRMRHPDTFRQLEQAGFREDYTLAFARIPGFRASTAVPHYFYDLETDRISSLLIRPTIVMDTSLIVHMGLSPGEAGNRIRHLIDECKKTGGDYLCLWHNSTLAGNRRNNQWIKVFDDSFRYACSLEKNN